MVRARVEIFPDSIHNLEHQKVLEDVMSFNKRDYLSRGDNRALLSRRNRRRVGTRFAIGLLAVAIMTLVAHDVTAQSDTAAAAHGANMPPGARCPVTGRTFSSAEVAAMGHSGAAHSTKNPTPSTPPGAIKQDSPGVAYSNQDWWPNQLRLEVLHQNSK